MFYLGVALDSTSVKQANKGKEIEFAKGERTKLIFAHLYAKRQALFFH